MIKNMKGLNFLIANFYGNKFVGPKKTTTRCKNVRTAKTKFELTDFISI